MSTFDSVHWRDEAIHHLFDTIREMKRDVAHLEALVMNAEFDRDAALQAADFEHWRYTEAVWLNERLTKVRDKYRAERDALRINLGRETDEDGLPTNYCPDCPGGGRFCNKCLPPGPGCPCVPCREEYRS